MIGTLTIIFAQVALQIAQFGWINIINDDRFWQIANIAVDDRCDESCVVTNQGVFALPAFDVVSAKRQSEVIYKFDILRLNFGQRWTRCFGISDQTIEQWDVRDAQQLSCIGCKNFKAGQLFVQGKRVFNRGSGPRYNVRHGQVIESLIANDYIVSIASFDSITGDFDRPICQRQSVDFKIHNGLIKREVFQ